MDSVNPSEFMALATNFGKTAAEYEVTSAESSYLNTM